METFRTFASRVAALFRRRKLDADLEDEISNHIELATEENIARGMNPPQARKAALQNFGGPTQIKEIYRRQRGFPLLDQVGRDLRYALRQLFRAPGFAATAILTLALGLGANTAIFSLINALLLRPLPVPHAEQLTVLSYSRSDSAQFGNYFNAPLIRALERNHPGLASFAAFNNTRFEVRSGSATEQIPAAMVTGDFFEVLETKPLLGRYLTRQDDQPGTPAGLNVVLSYSFWKTRYHQSPDVIGRAITIANRPFTIVGVMPKEFIGADPISRPSLFASLAAEPVIDAPYNNIASGYNSWWIETIARRPRNVSVAQADASIQTVTNALLEASAPDPQALANERQSHFSLHAGDGSRGFNFMSELSSKPLTVISVLCGCMLLLACLNLASLLTARAAGRERELATRLAIGASRGRLLQQLLIESLLVAILGAGAGLLIVPAIDHFLTTLLTGINPDAVIDTSLDFRVYAFVVAIAVLAALITGLVPALHATSGKTGKLNSLNAQMKSGGNGRVKQHARGWLPRILMGTEVALSLMLVIGAGLLASSLTRLYRTGLGFEPKGIVNFDLSMSKQSLDGDQLIHWYQAYASALEHLPGVTSVTYANITPLSGSIMKNTYQSSSSKGDQSLFANDVAPNYFNTMRIALLEGRDFTWNDTSSAPHRVILNRSAANLLFPGQDAIGRSVKAGKTTLEVIGVVADVHYASIREQAPPTAYRSITQGGMPKASYTAMVRLSGPVAPFAEAVRGLTTRMAPEIPLPALTTMSAQLDDSIIGERMLAILSSFFALCSLLVTAIGLYGTLAYATSRRTNEIGIRMALGAQRTQVVLLVCRENLGVAIGGTFAGLVVALLASRVLISFLYATSSRDPYVLTGAVASLALIASAASLLPAIRAARIEPMQALRAE
jgi:predicted permease